MDKEFVMSKKLKYTVVRRYATNGIIDQALESFDTIAKANKFIREYCKNSCTTSSKYSDDSLFYLDLDITSMGVNDE